MSRRIIPITVANEYVQGAGAVVGAAGSHDDVVLRMTFGDMWDGTTKKITWIDALGQNPVFTELTAGLLEPGSTEIYLVPIPAEPKAIPGKMTMTVKGVTVEDEEETTATLTAAASFEVLASAWDDSAEASADIDATLADQLQEEIDEILEDIVDLHGYAEASEAWAVGKKNGVDVPSTDPAYHNNAKYYAEITHATVIQDALPLGGGTMLGNIDMDSHKVTGLAAPTQDSDACTKKYVDDICAGIETALAAI